MLSRDLNPVFIAAVNALLRELRKRGAANDYCFRCQTNDWNADVVRVSAVPMPLASSGTLGPPPTQAYIPTLSLVCKNCGNMILHNLQSLTKDDPLLLRRLGFKE